nr:MAG TPA_asm: hypothetical protein [Caudoviricetes sp.]
MKKALRSRAGEIQLSAHIANMKPMPEIFVACVEREL